MVTSDTDVTESPRGAKVCLVSVAPTELMLYLYYTSYHTIASTRLGISFVKVLVRR
jgi:hypothetical protein